GRTALSWAAGHGHDAVVKELLSYGSHNPNGDGATPLLRVAWGGHVAVVKLLVSWEDVNPDRPDKDGRTPLLIAVKKRRPSVERLLRDRIAADAPVP
ncbi:ankyrin, partial [Choiromyces venosus 120613-1]